MRNHLRTRASGAIAAFLLVGAGGSCDDDGTSPGGGGPTASTLVIPAGEYGFSLVILECTSLDTLDANQGTFVACEPDTSDDFIGFPCPVRRVGNLLSVDCTVTQEATPGCNQTFDIAGRGVTSGAHWELSGRITVVDSPGNCAGGSLCGEFVLELDRLGDPSACP
jgi:hypothetical protein